MDRAITARLADVVVENLRTPFPYHLAAMVRGPDEALAPAARTPMFASCYDWHSSVHNHWALVRLRPWLDDARAAAADRALDASITTPHAAAELCHLDANATFERPYGLAWLVALGAAVSGSVHGSPRGAILAPLVRLARDRLVAWAGALARPIRSGEHAQSMFAMALALDAARAGGDDEAEAVLAAAAHRLHDGDRDAPFAYEPSAYDFLSPALATAWLVSRVHDADGFARWLDGFAPTLGRGFAPAPVVAVDKIDGKLVHWDGLALSRAWMLIAIAGALPAGDARAAPIAAAARVHLDAGLRALDGATYAGAHWLPSFAVYALEAFEAVEAFDPPGAAGALRNP